MEDKDHGVSFTPVSTFHNIKTSHPTDLLTNLFSKQRHHLKTTITNLQINNPKPNHMNSHLIRVLDGAESIRRPVYLQ